MGHGVWKLRIDMNLNQLFHSKLSRPLFDLVVLASSIMAN